MQLKEVHVAALTDVDQSATDVELEDPVRLERNAFLIQPQILILIQFFASAFPFCLIEECDSSVTLLTSLLRCILHSILLCFYILCSWSCQSLTKAATTIQAAFRGHLVRHATTLGKGHVSQDADQPPQQQQEDDQIEEQQEEAEAETTQEATAEAEAEAEVGEGDKDADEVGAESAEQTQNQDDLEPLPEAEGQEAPADDNDDDLDIPGECDERTTTASNAEEKRAARK